MSAQRLLGACCIAGMAAITMAAPPGPMDGVDIPLDFGPSNLVATQRNHTDFGDYHVIPGALVEGSETDQLFLSKSGTKLYVGVTGNLATNGNAWIIGIGISGRVGHTELRTEGVSGPPFTLQAAGRETTNDDNGTPADPTDDVWLGYGANGTILPCDTDYALAIDVFGGTMFVSEYELLDPSITPTAAGTWDPTPDNPADPPVLPDLFAFRNFVGQTPTNDGDDVFSDALAVGYNEGGFDNSNVLGVTDTDGSSAATAITGMELGIPFTRIGALTGTETIELYVLHMDGVGDGTGTVTNQLLPPLGPGAPCDPPASVGLRPDLTGVVTCLSVDLSNLPTFVGLADGDLSDPVAEGYVLSSTQTCPTSFGDQFFDPLGFDRGGGSELDAMYVTSDAVNLYLGITGNLEENGNRMLIFLDNGLDIDPPGTGPEDGEHILTWDGFGVGGNGLEGDAMPPLESDTLVDALFDYTLAVNATGAPPNSDVFVDLWDITGQMSTFKGRATMESGSGDLDGSGSNQWNLQVALNNLNAAGVVSCAFFENPCWFETDATVATAAADATSGFEIAVPLADLGINPCDGPATIHVWSLVTGNDGWRSNQALPSLRGVGEEMVKGGTNNVTDWYVSQIALPEEFYRAVAITEVTTPGIENDCDGSGTEDVCDILNGLVDDLDMDGIPDVCANTCAVDSDCDDLTLCTVDQCGGNGCAVVPTLFGDINSDGFRSADDVNCLLDDVGGNGESLACCDQSLGTCSGPGDTLPAAGFQDKDVAPCMGCPQISVNPDVYDCNIDCSVTPCAAGLTCTTLGNGAMVCRDPNNMGDGFKSADDVNAVLDTIGGAVPNDLVMTPCTACTTP